MNKQNPSSTFEFKVQHVPLFILGVPAWLITRIANEVIWGAYETRKWREKRWKRGLGR
jgi:hypothetical protein